MLVYRVCRVESL